jgi:hypothetical protein
MAFGISLGGLLGGNDRQLAATKYAGKTSATETARAARRARHFRNAKEADAQGAAWERREQLRQDRWT